MTDDESSGDDDKFDAEYGDEGAYVVNSKPQEGDSEEDE